MVALTSVFSHLHGFLTTPCAHTWAIPGQCQFARPKINTIIETNVKDENTCKLPEWGQVLNIGEANRAS